MSSKNKMILVALIVLNFVNLIKSDCWETDQCQLDSWAVKGCAQYGRVEQSRRPCPGGNLYTCCTSTQPATNGDCWETDTCQLDTWAVKGCAQYGRVEQSRRPCPGGNLYTCCTSTTPSNNGGVQNGKTTRYWDCCKPSCAWNGKAAVSSPVKTCQRNGIDAIDANSQSGCNSGPAYTCNNNQPFVGANNVAYGFAAAHISGQGERDWCCACYELTFTSGPVNGQKMIVQVTNTGGDLGENHFDLQIPGGGVGIFNGCQSQWGAPANGWGQRYGGVSSASECSSLPSQLQSGCNWRFGWFKNADNPTMSFKKITCPTELTSKTGCIRSS